MKTSYRGHIGGFTLIELLVVVLIIGILSAVALPQYTKAVNKAKAAEAWTLGKAFFDAQNIFYVDSGHYASSLDELGVEFPTDLKNWEMVYDTSGVTSDIASGKLTFSGKGSLSGNNLIYWIASPNSGGRYNGVPLREDQRHVAVCQGEEKVCRVISPCTDSPIEDVGCPSLSIPPSLIFGCAW